jgi:hypothetical protein
VADRIGFVAAVGQVGELGSGTDVEVELPGIDEWEQLEERKIESSELPQSASDVHVESRAHESVAIDSLDIIKWENSEMAPRLPEDPVPSVWFSPKLGEPEGEDRGSICPISLWTDNATLYLYLLDGGLLPRIIDPREIGLLVSGWGLEIFDQAPLQSAVMQCEQPAARAEILRTLELLSTDEGNKQFAELGLGSIRELLLENLSQVLGLSPR